MNRRLDLYITALNRRNDVLAESVLILFRMAVDLVAKAYRSFQAAYDRRSAINELSALDDKLLKDIGLHRGDIRQVVETLSRAEETSSAVTRRPVAKTVAANAQSVRRDAANDNRSKATA